MRIRNIYHFIIYEIPDGIGNLIKWFPIVWKDRDWDHNFLYKVMYFKLKNMEKYFKEDGHLIRSPSEAKKMKKCILVLDRLINDKHHSLVFRPHDKKWGRALFSWKKGDTSRELKITRKNVKTKKDEEQERKEFRARLYQETYLIQQDIDYLFNMMRKHIQNWWD